MCHQIIKSPCNQLQLLHHAVQRHNHTWPASLRTPPRRPMHHSTHQGPLTESKLPNLLAHERKLSLSESKKLVTVIHVISHLKRVQSIKPDQM
mmetsp:Transcript_16557/g.35825  ORF Transcript_16557/g.35825 Transcript_16557/m.35825 type:complete len:93 (-) Transcript_16557:1731-2009(-)